MGPRVRSERPARNQTALDTGATATTIHPGILLWLGYDPASSPERVAMTTASTVERVPKVAVNRIEVPGEQRGPFVVVGHALPPSATVDGPLGLGLFRGLTLVVNSRTGEILAE